MYYWVTSKEMLCARVDNNHRKLPCLGQSNVSACLYVNGVLAGRSADLIMIKT